MSEPTADPGTDLATVDSDLPASDIDDVADEDIEIVDEAGEVTEPEVVDAEDVTGPWDAPVAPAEKGTAAVAPADEGPGPVAHQLPKSEPPERSGGGGGGGSGRGGFGIASRPGPRPINVNLLPIHMSAHLNTTLALASGNTLGGIQIAAGVSGRRPRSSGRRRPRRNDGKG